jgi:hypothetical protein
MTTNITRRAVLAGAPAIAAAAALPAAASTNPDADLLAAVARYPVVNQAYCDALNAEEEVRFAVRASVPFHKSIAWPHWMVQEPKREPMRADDLVDRYGRKPKKLRAALRKSEVYEAEVNQRLAAAGWPALKSKAEALDAERSRLLQQILDTRATTPQGMLAKLDGVSEAFDEQALESVIVDLRALVGGAS